MEDKHTVLLSLKEDKDAAFFAVFDGHGGEYQIDVCLAAYVATDSF